MARRLAIGLLLSVLFPLCPLWAQESDRRSDGRSAADQNPSIKTEWVDLYWEDRLHVESKGGAFKLEIGARFITDFGHVDVSEGLARELDVNSGGEARFRAVRVLTEAQIYERFGIVFQYDFSKGEPHFKDVYISIKKIPYLGALKVGHMDEPFSLETVMSISDITFMEGGLLEAFAPARNLGVLFYDSVLNERMTWAAGGFHEVPDLDRGYSSENPFNLTFRMTGLPWYEEEGRRLVHLGLSYSHKFTDPDRPVSFSTGPESSLVETDFADTGDIDADGVDLLGLEAATVYGPFSAQAEYVHARVNAQTNPGFHGFYIYGSYILTGENRGYGTDRGVFETVEPKRKFNPLSGDWGAWEVGLRYSLLDLDDEDISGGRLHGVTAGLNWYLNKHVRLMANYTRSDREGVGNADIVQSRLQVEF